MEVNASPAMSVREWIREGEPMGVPFVLVRESMELPPPDSEDFDEVAKRELKVLGYLMKNCAESYSSTYTIEALPISGLEGQWLERRDDMSFLVRYDPMRNILTGSARICIMSEVKPRRNYSESRGGRL